MKKTTRNFLIMLAVLVVLGGAAAALLLTNPPETEGEASSAVSSTPAEAIMDKDPADVVSISIKNTEGSFEMVPVEKSASTSVASEESASSGVAADTVEFTVKGYESYNLDLSQVSSGARSILILNAAKNLGEQDSLEQFGLTGDSAVTAVITYRDGTKDELVLGSKAGETSGKYLLKDGVVYIASTVSDQLYGSPMVYFNTSVYSVQDIMEETVDSAGSSTQQAAADILYSMKLSGTNFAKPIEIKYDSNKTSAYVITAPLTAESGSTKFSELLSGLKTLSANSVAAAGRTAENLEKYGLTEPYAKIEFNMNNEDHTLAVTKADSEGKRYLVADDIDVIYEVSTDTVGTWADVSLMDLRMSYVWLPNIMEVSKLTIAANGTDYVMNATRTKNEEKSTEENVAYDLTLKNGPGKDVDYTNYQSFYKQSISIAVLSTEETAYTGAPVLSLRYDYFNGNGADTVEYYAVEGQDRYAAVLNGQFNGLVRKAEVDKVMTLVPDLNENKALS